MSTTRQPSVSAATIRTRLLAALSIVGAIAPGMLTSACKKEPAVWVPDEKIVKSSAGHCGTGNFCTTRLSSTQGDGGDLYAECGSAMAIPKSVAFEHYEGKMASLGPNVTEQVRRSGKPTACCFFYSTGPCGKGRPMRAENGAMVLASEVQAARHFDPVWTSPLVTSAGSRRELRFDETTLREITDDARALCTDNERALVARHMRHIARLEHGSVAAFARVSLELMALGASADLVAAAHRAALDEIRHAQIFWSLAAKLEGVAYGPGPMTLPSLDASIADVDQILRAAVIEGCIGETLGSALLFASARACAIPSLATLLDAIGEDELQHAELAFQIVRFVVDLRSPLVVDTADDAAERLRRLAIVSDALDSEHALHRDRGADAVATGTPPPPPHVPNMGVLGPDAQRVVFDEAFAELIAPVVQALVAPSCLAA